MPRDFFIGSKVNAKPIRPIIAIRYPMNLFISFVPLCCILWGRIIFKSFSWLLVITSMEL
jgi:hypothetical protein